MVKAVDKFAIGLCLVLFSFSLAEGIESPLNGLTLDLNEKSEEYSFLLAGHLYGSPDNRFSAFPSSSFLANIDRINSIGSKFFISLGDNYRRADDAHISSYKASVTSKLNMPLFNSAGNHDLTDRNLYEQNFGDTYYHFAYNHELFVILDSELNAGEIIGDQLNFFLDVIRNAINTPEINNVFILSHKLIWSVNNPDYQIVFQHLNARSGYADNYNFKSEIEPTLIELSKHRSVYWISGDIGCSWSLPIFYQKDQNSGVTYIATGIGDTVEDAILQVNVAKSGDEVTFIPVSLTGQEMQPVEHYGLEYWKEHFDAKVSEPKWTEKWLRILRHRYFWAGIFVAYLSMGFCVFVWKRLSNGGKSVEK
ncbi:metallophosphoesterase family protein [Candidatus Poribacteria bacterium]